MWGVLKSKSMLNKKKSRCLYENKQTKKKNFLSLCEYSNYQINFPNDFNFKNKMGNYTPIWKGKPKKKKKKPLPLDISLTKPY